MKFSKRIIIGAICASMVCVPQALLAKDKGGYVAGDFHNHTVFTDGSTSIDKLITTSLLPRGMSTRCRDTSTAPMATSRVSLTPERPMH